MREVLCADGERSSGAWQENGGAAKLRKSSRARE